jgi:hypothetical protein
MLIFGIMTIQLLILFVAANSVVIVCNTIFSPSNTMENSKTLASSSNQELLLPESLPNDNGLKTQYYNERIKLLKQETSTRSSIFSANVLRMITTYEAMITNMDQGIRNHEQEIDRLRQDPNQDSLSVQEKIDKINKRIESVQQSRKTAIRNIELLLEEDGEDRLAEQRKEVEQIRNARLSS